jgi:formate-dependent nitrite reductase cytochrome c552 subunit
MAAAICSTAAGSGRAQESADSNLGYFAKPRYIGSVYCYACHLDLSRDFAKTKMGKRFLLEPKTPLERLGCEGCHGPGSNHAISGGGESVGGLVEFRIDRGQSIETANQACMSCHDEAFWHGGTHGARRMACFDCHLVMTRMSRSGQLAPPYSAFHMRRRRWAVAAGAGLLIGLFTGAVFRRRRARNDGPRDRGSDVSA